MNGLFRVVVSDALDLLVNADVHAEFLAKFAAQTFLEALARLALAAGKVPQASEVAAIKTLRDEELASTEEQTGADFDGSANCELRIANRLRIACRVLWRIRHSEFAIRPYLPTLL